MKRYAIACYSKTADNLTLEISESENKVTALLNHSFFDELPLGKKLYISASYSGKKYGIDRLIEEVINTGEACKIEIKEI